MMHLTKYYLLQSMKDQFRFGISIFVKIIKENINHLFQFITITTWTLIFVLNLLAPSLHLFARKRINYEESVYIYTFYFHIYQRLYLCSVASHGCIEVNMICVYIRKEILLACFMVSMKFFASVYKHGVLIVRYKI